MSQANRIADQARRWIQKSNWLDMHEARTFLDGVFDVIGSELRDHGEVTIPHFGKFTVRVRKAHATRHPKTREPVAVPANVEVRFSAATDLEARLESWLTRAK